MICAQFLIFKVLRIIHCIMQTNKAVAIFVRTILGKSHCLPIAHHTVPIDDKLDFQTNANSMTNASIPKQAHNKTVHFSIRCFCFLQAFYAVLSF